MSNETRRQVMVDRGLVARGIRDSHVIRAMTQVPREEFVLPATIDRAFDDCPLAIGYGQTISQPYVVALALEALEIEPEHNVLDVGTGSGYAAAVMSRLAAKVTSIERIPALAKSAAERLARLGYPNVEVVCGDGSVGYAPDSPYDVIYVAAAGPEISDQFVEQVRDGGRIVMPIATSEGQRLILGTCLDGKFDSHEIASVRFVPLVGEGGYERRSRFDDES